MDAHSLIYIVVRSNNSSLTAEELEEKCQAILPRKKIYRHCRSYSNLAHDFIIKDNKVTTDLHPSAIRYAIQNNCKWYHNIALLARKSDEEITILYAQITTNTTKNESSTTAKPASSSTMTILDTRERNRVLQACRFADRNSF